MGADYLLCGIRSLKREEDPEYARIEDKIYEKYGKEIESVDNALPGGAFSGGVAGCIAGLVNACITNDAGLAIVGTYAATFGGFLLGAYIGGTVSIVKKLRLKKKIQREFGELENRIK